MQSLLNARRETTISVFLFSTSDDFDQYLVFMRRFAFSLCLCSTKFIKNRQTSLKNTECRWKGPLGIANYLIRSGRKVVDGARGWQTLQTGVQGKASSLKLLWFSQVLLLIVSTFPTPRIRQCHPWGRGGQ